MTATEKPKRKWPDVCRPFFDNWQEPHKSQTFAALAAENGLAEGLGFTCVPDSRHGDG